jgi:hypothetical protein
MALKFSTGAVNNVAAGMGWGDLMKNGTIKVYSGTQPATANDAPSGATLLCQFTTNSGALTNETRAACKIVLAAGAAGSVDSINVGGMALMSAAVTYATSLTNTAQLVVDNINNNLTTPDVYAVMGGTAVGGITYGAANAGEFYLIAPKNVGTAWNSVTVTTTSTTLTIALNTDATPSTAETGAFAAVSGDSVSGFTAGVAAVNGLTMTYPAVAGLISKNGTWGDSSADNSGTATWFRYICNPNYDDGSTSLNTTGVAAYLISRIDGSVGTSGADMLISNASITASAAQTVNQFDFTVPSS